MIYESQTKQQIGKWLHSMVKKGASGARAGVTMGDVERETGIPRNTLKWLAYKNETANISPERQRALSKLMAECENGRLDFKPGIRKGGRSEVPKVAFVPEAPRPVLRYNVHIGPRGVGLTAAPRPRLPENMPKLKDLL